MCKHCPCVKFFLLETGLELEGGLKLREAEQIIARSDKSFLKHSSIQTPHILYGTYKQVSLYIIFKRFFKLALNYRKIATRKFKQTLKQWTSFINSTAGEKKITENE